MHRIFSAESTHRAKDGHLIPVELSAVMPNMSGRDCFRRMREINPKARVVLSSGYSMDGSIQDVMNEGILAFIQKPYRLEELSRVVVTAVGTYQ